MKKILSLLLALAMVLTVVPATVFADYQNPIEAEFDDFDWIFSEDDFDDVEDNDISVELAMVFSSMLGNLVPLAKDPKYNALVKTAYHEAEVAMQGHPKLATYIAYVAKHLPTIVSDALIANNLPLAMYFLTTFEEIVAEIVAKPEEAKYTAWLASELFSSMDWETYLLSDDENFSLSFAVALHAAYLEAKAAVSNDPENAYYLCTLAYFYMYDVAVAAKKDRDAEAAALLGVFAGIAAELKAENEESKYIATLGAILLSSLNGNPNDIKIPTKTKIGTKIKGIVATVDSIGRLYTAYGAVRAAAKSLPELKEQIYYVGMEYIYALASRSTNLVEAADVAATFAVIYELIKAYPEKADAIAIAGASLLYNISCIGEDAEEDNVPLKKYGPVLGYTKSRLMYHNAFVEVLVSMGINEQVIQKIEEKVAEEEPDANTEEVLPEENEESNAVQFLDVDPNAWYADAIAYCVENDIMHGVDANIFNPNGTLTFVETLTTLWNIAGNPKEEYKGDFVDVNPAAWYIDAVAWALNNKIINYSVDGKLRLAEPIDRQALAKIIYNFQQYKGVDTDAASKDTNTLSYEDVFTIEEWAAPAMHYCIAAGIIQGNDEGYLLPFALTTRAQFATIMMRFNELQ